MRAFCRVGAARIACVRHVKFGVGRIHAHQRFEHRAGDDFSVGGIQPVMRVAVAMGVPACSIRQRIKVMMKIRPDR
jgi:hypothetical protein